jgi:hypothetical protein
VYWQDVLDLHLAYQVLARRLRRELRSPDLSMTEVLILRIAANHPNVGMTELRVSTGLNRTSLSSAIARLRDRTMLIQYEVPGDRRHRTIELTHVGSGSALMLDPALGAINRRLGWRFDNTEPQTIAELADALHEIEHPWGAARLG